MILIAKQYFISAYSINKNCTKAESRRLSDLTRDPPLEVLRRLKADIADAHGVKVNEVVVVSFNRV